MPDEEAFLELLEIYMNLVDKQDEIIRRLGKVVAKQVSDIEQFKTVNGFMDLCLDDEETEELKESLDEYEKMKGID